MTAGVATYLGGRLLGALPMLFLMSLVVFAIVYLIPGDPVDAMLGQDAEQSAREDKGEERQGESLDGPRTALAT